MNDWSKPFLDRVRDVTDENLAHNLRRTMGRPLSLVKAEIRAKLEKYGTDVEKNDADPTGDGDQSPIHLNFAGKQVYRDLFAAGGDIQAHFVGFSPALSCFALACVFGIHEKVKEAIMKVFKPGVPSEDLIKLLETRETSMRLSPLQMLISMGKSPTAHAFCGGNADRLAEQIQSQKKVARLLLAYGARPDAKDVVGKTVCHYGAGVMATEMTLAVVDMCIPAAASCHLFGKDVELYGLSNEAMNGKRGIASGYHVDTGRRSVYLPDAEKYVAVKPDNLRLLGQERFNKNMPKLCDVQDRLGSVCLLDLFNSDKVDVVEHLMQKHGASIEVTDWDGFSPKSMATNCGTQMNTPVAPLVLKYSMKQGRAEKKAEKQKCTLCGNTDSKERPLSLCSRCKSVQYCSKTCQTKDWKSKHKKHCKLLCSQREGGILLERPEISLPRGMKAVSISNSKGKMAQGDYVKPDNVDVGEKFYIKVQANDSRSPLFVYDKTRQCTFIIQPKARGYDELFQQVKSEKASGGMKSFFKASFDSAGNCTVYPGMRTLKMW